MGIYKIVHVFSNRIYIGSTKNFNKRFTKHKFRFKNNKNNKFMQNVYNKSKPEDFSMEILEIIKEEKNLLSVEQYYLDKYFDNQKKCFNMCPLASNTAGFKFSEEQKKELSIIKSKEITLISPNDEKITRKGINAFCLEYSLNKKCLQKVVYGERKSYKGWRKPENFNYNYSEFIKKFNKINNSKKRKVYNIKLVAPDGKIYGPIFDMNKFCKDNNLPNPSNVRKLISGSLKTYKKWRML